MATSLDQLRAQHPNLSDDAIADLAALSLRMSGDRKTRSGFLGLVKEVAPNTPIPELDTAAVVDERIKAERDAREKFESEQRQRWLQEDLTKTKNEVRSKFSLTDTDFSTMEKMMTEKQLPADYNWAAQIYKQQTESTTPTNYGSSGYGPLDLNRATQEKGFEGLMDDPDNWANRTAHQMIDDVQRKGRPNAF